MQPDLRNEDERELFQHEMAVLRLMRNQDEATKLAMHAVHLERHKIAEKAERLAKREKLQGPPDNAAEIVESVKVRACKETGMLFACFDRTSHEYAPTRWWMMTALLEAYGRQNAAAMLGITDIGIANGVYTLKQRDAKCAERARAYGAEMVARKAAA